jgi:hypothetical protein
MTVPVGQQQQRWQAAAAASGELRKVRCKRVVIAVRVGIRQGRPGKVHALPSKEGRAGWKSSKYLWTHHISSTVTLR